MASTRTIPVGEDFDINLLTAKLTQIYQSKGYTVTAFPVGRGVTIEFSKNNSAWYNIIGMMEGAKVSLVVMDGILNINYTDEKWIDKIIAFAIGWLCCWITWVTGGIGAYNQIQFTRNVANDIMMIVSK